MIRRVLASAVAAVVLLVGLAPGASAHDALASSNPADGAQVDVVPAQVELRFSSTPLGVGTEVQVTGPSGDLVSVGTPQVVDTAVIQPVAADLPAGTYRVLWRVTSSDGHPISGELAFTATTGAPEPAAATRAPAAVPGAGDDPPATGGTSGTSGTAEAGELARADGSAPASPAVGWVSAVVGAGLLAALLGLVVRFRRSRGRAAGRG